MFVCLLSALLLTCATASSGHRLASQAIFRASPHALDKTIRDQEPMQMATIGKVSSPDGRVATILTYKDIMAKDTQLPSYMKIALRQISDGTQVVSAVLDQYGQMMDCVVSKDQNAISRFIDDFTSSQMNVKPDNVTFVPRKYFNEEILKMVNLRRLVKSCHDYHKQMFVGYRLQSMAKGSNSKRNKRSIIFPGTKWCGKGDDATNYTNLGNNANTDRCCRMHDHCPYTILGFSTKYGVFNHRFHTVSHCDCDYSFRTCLKTAGSAAANMIGTIYFNVVRLPCFIFVPKLTCVEWTWWGKCVKEAPQYVAEVQEALDYNSHV